jgi:hypothetical protein
LFRAIQTSCTSFLILCEEQQQLSRLQTEYDTGLKETNIDDPRSFKDEVWSSDVKNWRIPMRGNLWIPVVVCYQYMTILWLTRSLSNGQWYWKQIPHMHCPPWNLKNKNKVYQYGKSSQI